MAIGPLNRQQPASTVGEDVERHFPQCEVTIEAVVEKVEVKRAVLAEWEQSVPEIAIFGSNTSTIPLRELLAAETDPVNA